VGDNHRVGAYGGLGALLLFDILNNGFEMRNPLVFYLTDEGRPSTLDYLRLEVSFSSSGRGAAATHFQATWPWWRPY
jgi:hypothetical protein